MPEVINESLVVKAPLVSAVNDKRKLAQCVAEQSRIWRTNSLLGLVVVVACTPETVTSPNELPKTEDTSPDCSTVAKVAAALLAALESAPVNATVWETTIEPAVTESIVTFVKAPSEEKILAWRVLTNCREGQL